ncbi:MAG: RrF2 family transcriptional regulator [Phycisphaerales bacterium]
MFTSTTEYALRAAVVLAEYREGYHTAQSVAEAAKVSVQYMSKVLKHLAEAGVAVSQRGPSGGFALAKPPSEITLLDIVQAVEPVERIACCPLGLKEHQHELCPLHKALDDLALMAQHHLCSKNLADMVAQPIVPLGITAAKRESA